MLKGLLARAPQDSQLSALAAAMAALALGHALQFANGAYTPNALFWVSVALGLAVVATLAFQSPPAVRRGESGVLLFVAAAGIAHQVSVHLTTSPGIYLRVGADAFSRHHDLVAAAAVVAGVLVGLEARWKGARAAAVVVFCAIFLQLGVWMLKASPAPIIDVFTWHQVALDALAHGNNPWSIFMPNVYGHTIWYAPGLADAAQVKVGYPYPPLLLLLGGLGHLVASDYRYAHVVAYVGAGALLAFARPGRYGPIAVAILFLTPRSLFVIEQGWTEPIAMFMFCLTVFCACRWPRMMPYALGLLFAVKQYFVLLAPLTVLLLPGPFSWRALGRVLLRAGAVAAVLNVPFFLWDPGGFWRSVVEFQGRQPFRVEALSYVAATARGGQPTLPLWLSFPVIIPALLLGCWRAPRSPAGFSAAAALTFLLFFVFAKQAFCNYYFLIIGMLCAALATTVPLEPPAPALASAGPAAPPTQAGG